MTMIRINLIAEKKAAAPKAVKKQASGAPSEIQENAILIAAFLVAVAISLGMAHLTERKFREVKAEENRLQAEWEEVKHWETKKEDYEIQAKMLNDKINKISELKDTREGPVQLMEDVYNIMPDSVWMTSLRQGYENSLIAPTKSGRKTTRMPGRNLGTPREFHVEGFASSAEAATNFADRLLNMESRYHKVSLNDITLETNADQPNAYFFNLYFDIKPKRAQTPTGNEGG